MRKKAIITGGESILSVIVPTYNCEEYINEGIDSILNQLPDNCELIIVDDGSTDRTSKVLREYEARDNVAVIYSEHKGASGARNTGIDNANGRYITFMDCDDMLQEGFIDKGLKLIESGVDLYIFSIERYPLRGENEVWGVDDIVYPGNAEFADAFIIKGRLMVYSNCNKFYKKSIIDKEALRFKEGVVFGEDRLFNFDYIKLCEGRIVTSSLIQYKYMQRSEESMSTRYLPDYFKKIIELHQAKADCFINLSRNTTDEQKQEFIRKDIISEIRMALERCEKNPKEREENLSIINKYISDNNIILEQEE